LGRRRVLRAAPEIDDRLAVEGDDHRGADIGAAGEIGLERRPHAGEAVVAMALDGEKFGAGAHFSRVSSRLACVAMVLA
jgi:hypothetical protein